MNDLKALLEAPQPAQQVLDALTARLDKLEAAQKLDEEKMKLLIAESIGGTALEDTVKDWARDTLEAKIADYSFERRVTDLMEDYDFSRPIERAVESAVESAVDDAFSNHDWAESVSDALGDIDLEDHVSQALDRLDIKKPVREAVSEVLKEAKVTLQWTGE
jgi:hypothetical protein